VSAKAFERILKTVKDMLPKNNELSSTTDEAKHIVCHLRLEVWKIHACCNDCILYHSVEYNNLDTYFV
jgi:hypothetical protein